MDNNHIYYVYILTNRKNGSIYIGITNNLLRRTIEHQLVKNKTSFTAKYHINKLVYFETYHYIYHAITREKQLKHWPRKWKLVLIEKCNYYWNDLFEVIR